VGTIWHDLVHVGVPAGEKVIRTLLVYLIVLVLLRLFGKRQLAQLNALDLVVLLLLSNVVQNALIGPDDSVLGAALGAATLVTANYLLIRLTFMHDRLMHLVQGKPTTLVEHGQVDDRALHQELITRSELDSALRREGTGGIAAVESVMLDPEGTLTPVRKPEPGIRDVLDRLDRLEEHLGGHRR
jgi:uncharacterized membrane protein YcaP (DUF421 family)